jgi:hypothetical protein
MMAVAGACRPRTPGREGGHFVLVKPGKQAHLATLPQTFEDASAPMPGYPVNFSFDYDEILPFVPDPQPYGFDEGSDSLAVSGHKLIDWPIPCRVVLTRKGVRFPHCPLHRIRGRHGHHHSRFPQGLDAVDALVRLPKSELRGLAGHRTRYAGRGRWPLTGKSPT